MVSSLSAERSVTETTGPQNGYSDLEVFTGGDLEVLRESILATRTLKQAEALSALTANSPSDPVPTYRSALSRQNTQKSCRSDESRNSVSKNADCAAVARPRNLVCGFSRNVFWSVVFGFAIFTIGVVVTVVAVLLHRHAILNASSSPLRTTVRAFNSSLAAANFTDPANVGRSCVVFQDQESLALMVSLYDTISNAWNTVNITASVMQYGHVNGLSVMAGTPLAIASSNEQLSIYYLTPTFNVAEVWSPVTGRRNSGFGSHWNPGVLSTTLTLTASPTSSLAAVWQFCASCSKSLLVMFEDSAGLLQIANLTQKEWTMKPTIASGTIAGSGLAASMFVDDVAIPFTGSQPTALRVYRVSDAGLLQELMYGPLGGNRWIMGNNGTPLDVFTAKPPPKIASITFGANNTWNRNLVITLANDGSLFCHHWSGVGWFVKSPILIATPAGFDAKTFTSIAATQAQKIYVTAGSTTHELSVDANADPFTWTYSRQVTTGQSTDKSKS